MRLHRFNTCAHFHLLETPLKGKKDRKGVSAQGQRGVGVLAQRGLGTLLVQGSEMEELGETAEPHVSAAVAP